MGISLSQFSIHGNPPMAGTAERKLKGREITRCADRGYGGISAPNSTPGTHPGNSSTAVKRAENSLLPVEAAAALVAYTVRESILASSVTMRWEMGALYGLRVFYVLRRRTYRGQFSRFLRKPISEKDERALTTCTAAHKPSVNMSAATKTENVITLKGSVAVDPGWQREPCPSTTTKPSGDRPSAA